MVVVGGLVPRGVMIGGSMMSALMVGARITTALLRDIFQQIPKCAHSNGELVLYGCGGDTQDVGDFVA